MYFSRMEVNPFSTIVPIWHSLAKKFISISCERRDYEKRGEESLSYAMSRKMIKKNHDKKG